MSNVERDAEESAEDAGRPGKRTAREAGLNDESQQNTDQVIIIFRPCCHVLSKY